MKSALYHIQLNGSDPEFYRALFKFLEWRVIEAGADHLGATDGRTAIWVIRVGAGYCDLPYHRKAAGLNHLAFRVGSRGDVDRFCREFLEPPGITRLYGGPREYPEYRPGYYAVYFEDPDRIKLEVVWAPDSPSAEPGSAIQ